MTPLDVLIELLEHTWELIVRLAKKSPDPDAVLERALGVQARGEDQLDRIVREHAEQRKALKDGGGK